MKIINLQSFDNVPLNCYLWDDVKAPKGVVQIAHGMAENAKRYSRFAEFLNQNGYIVFADDHRAHGLTESDENRGYHKGDIFQKTLKDLVFIHNYLKEKYNLPLFFIGHSYGSFLGQAFYQQDISANGVILMGSAYMPKHLSALATAFLSPMQLLCKDAKPKLINKLSDKLFALKYKGEKGKSLWITRDPDQRKKFINDPLAGITMSVNFIFSMIKGIYNLNKKTALEKINKHIPLMIASGDMDPIGGYGKKVKNLYKKYKSLGVEKIELKLYKDCRHELLNELNYKEVYNDILTFIKSVK